MEKDIEKRVDILEDVLRQSHHKTRAFSVSPDFAAKVALSRPEYEGAGETLEAVGTLLLPFLGFSWSTALACWVGVALFQSEGIFEFFDLGIHAIDSGFLF